MKRLVIERDKWVRGTGGMASALLNDEGRMCCLGFHAKSCGLGDSDIRFQASPSCAGAELYADTESDWLFRSFPSLNCGFGWVENVLIAINDEKKIDESTREAWLTEGFRVLGGIEVEFK